jgi:two-component sensor histidine kinase
MPRFDRISSPARWCGWRSIWSGAPASSKPSWATARADAGARRGAGGSDDGPGIAPDERAHLFERFRRGANVSASGSGLGLAIVKSAGRQIGARIENAHGLGGKGIGFRLRWPDEALARV